MICASDEEARPGDEGGFRASFLLGSSLGIIKVWRNCVEVEFNLPTALNPFKTRDPLTMLGRLGKTLNPLNPRNARAIFLEETIRAIAGKTLPQTQADDVSARAGYFFLGGPQVGIGLNILDAGPTSAYDTLEGQAELKRIQDARDLKKSLEAAHKRSVYIADDYGPPRPVRYANGNLVIDDYVVKRFDAPAAAETSGTQPVRDAVPPAAKRPSGSDTVPVSSTVPINPNPPKEEQTRVAVENELLEQAAKTERTSELMRQMVELGVTGGMTSDNMREWVGANQGLAENLIRDRLGRKERLAKEFA